MDLEHSLTQRLDGVLKSAAEFGLTSHEVWEAVVATPDHLPADLKARYIDELTGELARRLLENQRASHDALRSADDRLLPARSPLVGSGTERRAGVARRCLGWARRALPI